MKVILFSACLRDGTRVFAASVGGQSPSPMATDDGTDFPLSYFTT